MFSYNNSNPTSNGARGSSRRTSARAGRAGRSGPGNGYGQRPHPRGGDRYGNSRVNVGYGGYQQTSQTYAQNTTQLETQVVFVDQARTCLVVAESHLDQVASGAGADILSASASGMVACLNLMRMSALERTSDKDGLDAAKSMVKAFEEKCAAKYGSVSHRDRVKIQQIRDAVCGHMMSVLNGDKSVPVFEVSSMSPGGIDREEGGKSMTRAMQEVLRGGHEVEEMREKVRQDPGRYRDELQDEAKDGATWQGGEDHRSRFNADAARGVFQADMQSVGALRSGRDMDREAKASLKKVVSRDREVNRQSTNVPLDGSGAPDLMCHSDHEDTEMEEAHVVPQQAAGRWNRYF